MLYNENLRNEAWWSFL